MPYRCRKLCDNIPNKSGSRGIWKKYDDSGFCWVCSYGLEHSGLRCMCCGSKYRKNIRGSKCKRRWQEISGIKRI